MKQTTYTVTTMTAAELKAADPARYGRELREWQSQQYTYGLNWQAEIDASYKAVVEACGARLGGRDNCPRNGDRLDNLNDCDLRRSMAWLENQVLGPLRLKWSTADRDDNRKLYTARFYRPDMVPPCPFTGYCADDDFLDALKAAILRGDCPSDAVRGLAAVYERIIDAEWEDQTSEDRFLESDAEFEVSREEVEG